MKYYNESQMRDVRAGLEAEILKWPGVVSKEMMGCPCYSRGRTFFALLVTNGIVITKLAKEDRSRLSERPESKPFEMSGRTASSWIQLPLKKSGDLRPLLAFIRRSYEAASG